MSNRTFLNDDIDEAVVARLVSAIQTAVVNTASDRADEDGWIQVPAPELATALMSLLATVIEPAPACRTPSGMRLTAEAAGKELLQLIRDVRQLKKAGG